MVEGIAALEKRRQQNPALTAPPQGALIAMDVATGRILAMTGGTDYGTSRYNRATTARRQPGSAFKPILYAYAVEQGMHQASLVLDAPVSFPGSSKDQPWQPENFSGTWQGEITLRKALTHSKNIPSVRLLDQMGITNVIHFSRKLGITSQLTPYLSLALGSGEVTLMEMTAAYVVFANQGIYSEPYGVDSVTDANGQRIWQPDVEKHIAMTRESAAIVCNMLEGVISEGTGKGARSIRHPVAGKTGTTNLTKMPFCWIFTVSCRRCVGGM
ncbi:MAG: penicillin-binding transpeptidase domain-containing protein [Desulfobacterales bacterium]